MTAIYPPDFPRVPADPWVSAEVGDLALKYDTVEAHGWYSNLDPTLAEMAELIEPGNLIIDYSGGTGIMLDRLRTRADVPRDIAMLLVDASPKFLRVAFEKLGTDERVSFRWIRYLREQSRLERLDEVMSPALLERGADLIASTNAIHLYYGLTETLQSWHRVLRPGGKALIQSGNIRGASAPRDTWLIDETVGRIQPLAKALVELDDRYAEFRTALGEESMRLHTTERNRYFLPVRPLDFYLQHFDEAGFQVDGVAHRVIEAKVDDWYQFLSAYHDGVLGWAGGTEKINGTSPSEATVSLRLALLRESLERLFDHEPTFRACWTYLTCTRP